MNRSLIKSVFVACLCAASAVASAANRYVLQGASGRSDGSDWVNAYTALPSTLVRGDTYYVGAGTYSGRTFSTAASGSTLITIKKATATDHGTDAGWNNSFGSGQATFSGGLVFTSSFWLIDGQTGGGAENGWNVVPFGFKVIETQSAQPVIDLGGTSNVTLRHVELQGMGGSSSAGGSRSNDGVASYGAKNWTLSYFWMHGIGRCPFFFSGNEETVMEHGWVESFMTTSTSTHGEVMSSGQGFTGNTTFRFNLVTAIRSTGGLMWDNSSNPSAKFNVYGNVFYKPAGANWDKANGVVGGWTGGNGEQYRNVSVYNNTFINIDQESLSSFPNVFSGNVAYNNLFYNSQSPNFAKYATHDYNHFINSGGSHSETNGTSATSGDPFVNLVGRDFRLKVPTPAGVTLPAHFNVDAMGRVRGTSGTVSRGAFEFDGSAGSAGTALAAPTGLSVQ